MLELMKGDRTTFETETSDVEIATGGHLLGVMGETSTLSVLQ